MPLIELLKPKPSLVAVSESLFPRIGDYEVKQQLSGDGNAAFVSYLGTFLGDPKIQLVQWGNGLPPSNIPAEVIWTKKTNFPVYHVVFFFNPDVAAFVVSTLTGNEVIPKPIFEGSFQAWLKQFGSTLEGDAQVPPPYGHR